MAPNPGGSPAGVVREGPAKRSSKCSIYICQLFTFLVIAISAVFDAFSSMLLMAIRPTYKSSHFLCLQNMVFFDGIKTTSIQNAGSRSRCTAAVRARMQPEHAEPCLSGRAPGFKRSRVPHGRTHRLGRMRMTPYSTPTVTQFRRAAARGGVSLAQSGPAGATDS